MVTSLFHITHLANVPGIAQRGLLCRHRILAAGMTYVDLSDPECQSRRRHRHVAGRSVNLHDYVPLFFNPRNTMLYRLWRTQCERGQNGCLAILEISAEPAAWQGSLLSDGIASSDHSNLYRAVDPVGRAALDWQAIRKPEWYGESRDQRRRRMAEVLVSGSLSARHIRKVWVQHPLALQRLAPQLPGSLLASCQVDDAHNLFLDA